MDDLYSSLLSEFENPDAWLVLSYLFSWKQNLIGVEDINGSDVRVFTIFWEVVVLTLPISCTLWVPIIITRWPGWYRDHRRTVLIAQDHRKISVGNCVWQWYELGLVWTPCHRHDPWVTWSARLFYRHRWGWWCSQGTWCWHCHPTHGSPTRPCPTSIWEARILVY